MILRIPANSCTFTHAAKHTHVKGAAFPAPGDAAGVWSTSAHYLSTLIPLNRAICFHPRCKHICLSAPALQLRRAHTEFGASSLGIVSTWKKGRDTAAGGGRKKNKGSQAFTSLTVPKIMLPPWRMSMLISDLQSLTERLLLPCQKSVLRSFWMPEQNCWTLPEDFTV